MPSSAAFVVLLHQNKFSDHLWNKQKFDVLISDSQILNL
jgi:hypothetical protein